MAVGDHRTTLREQFLVGLDRIGVMGAVQAMQIAGRVRVFGHHRQSWQVGGQLPIEGAVVLGQQHDRLGVDAGRPQKRQPIRERLRYRVLVRTQIALFRSPHLDEAAQSPAHLTIRRNDAVGVQRRFLVAADDALLEPTLVNGRRRLVGINPALGDGTGEVRVLVRRNRM